MSEAAHKNSEFSDRLDINAKMKDIKHKLLVMSGKGGVGKSTVATNLATALSLKGFKVGLMDVDLHGPSIPTMLNITDSRITQETDNGLCPIEVSENLKVMSVAFFLEHNDQPVIWRGPAKIGMIKQFLKDVDWGQLDYLIIDSPPGTGDEPLSIVQLLPQLDGGIVVTTPQKVAAADVRKSVNFCHKLKLPITGVIENMSGFKCPCCDEVTHIFKTGGGEEMAQQMEIPFLGRLPIDPEICQACDDGKPYVDHFKESETAKRFVEIVEKITK